jgi:DNA-binding beta-propeller fold protein YncE
MTRGMSALLAAVLVALAASADAPVTLAAGGSAGPADSALCLDDLVVAAPGAAQEAGSGSVLDPNWPPGALGGEIAPIRSVYDPFPTFDGIALDVENGRVIFSDENRHSLLVYDRTAGSFSDQVTEPLYYITGPQTKLGYIAGVEVDAARKEFYTVNNDGADTMVVFAYGDHGNVRPRRYLYVPHQSWDVALAPRRDEIAVSVQQSNAVAVYRRSAAGTEPPVRTIRGPNTQLEDPHGVFFDEVHNEIITANHGNWTQIRPYTPYDPLVSSTDEYRPGQFHPPSIVFHAADANGDAKPLGTIEGPRTGLNWPMGIDVDLMHDEIAVANYGDSSVRIFRRADRGDVAPLRVIRGPSTGIVGPVGVAIDSKHNEIWVANYGDHTAVVFDRTANGDARPKRIVRNAPVGTPTCGFTNLAAAAYDSRRDAILVPN